MSVYNDQILILLNWRGPHLSIYCSNRLPISFTVGQWTFAWNRLTTASLGTYFTMTQMSGSAAHWITQKHKQVLILQFNISWAKLWHTEPLRSQNVLKGMADVCTLAEPWAWYIFFGVTSDWRSYWMAPISGLLKLHTMNDGRHLSMQDLYSTFNRATCPTKHDYDLFCHHTPSAQYYKWSKMFQNS